MKIVDFKFAFICYFSSTFVQAAEASQNSFSFLDALEEVTFTAQQVEKVNKLFSKLEYHPFDYTFTQLKYALYKYCSFNSGDILLINHIIDCYNYIKQFYAFNYKNPAEPLIPESHYNKIFKSKFSDLNYFLGKININCWTLKRRSKNVL